MSRELESAAEDDLVRRALLRDRDAFGELMLRYEASLISVLNGVVGNAELARDVAQEAFLRAWQFLDRYERAFRFSTWLFRIGVNLGISKLRRNRLENDIFSDAGVARLGLDRRAPSGDGPSDRLERDERARRVIAGVRELSPRYRQVLLLRYQDGLSCRDIAKKLGMTANSVSIVLHRGKMKLKEFIGSEGGEE